jgi:hypothetical protein
MDRSFHERRRLASLDPNDLAAQLRLVAAEMRQNRGPESCSTQNSWKERLENLPLGERPAAIHQLAKLGPVAVGVTSLLIQSIEDQLNGPAPLEDPLNTRRQILKDFLETIDNLGTGTHTALFQALKSSHSLVRSMALQALSRCARELIVTGAQCSLVMDCLQDSDGKIRYQAADLLRALGRRAKASTAALSYRLSDPDRNVRIMCLLALRKMGPGEGCVDMLLRSLKDPEKLVRYWSARVLGEMGVLARDARTSLFHSLIDDQDAVRKAANDALGKINRSLS